MIRLSHTHNSTIHIRSNSKDIIESYQKLCGIRKYAWDVGQGDSLKPSNMENPLPWTETNECISSIARPLDNSHSWQSINDLSYDSEWSLTPYQLLIYHNRSIGPSKNVTRQKGLPFRDWKSAIEFFFHRLLSFCLLTLFFAYAHKDTYDSGHYLKKTQCTFQGNGKW